MEEYIVKVYLSYSNVIKFDNVIKVIASQYSMSEMRVCSVSRVMVDGVVAQLKLYAGELFNTSKQSDSVAQQTININNVANANSTANVGINFDVVITDARQQVEDAGLSDDQYRQVLEKLDELEKIAKSKESKGKRWQRAKEIMKWIAEQGIQVAGIVIPVLARSIS